MVVRLPYVVAENAKPVVGSEYLGGSLANAIYEADDCDDDGQAEELALRFYAKFPPADLAVWRFDFPVAGK